MSLDADLIVDRRRMRRKLTFWRVLAIAVIILAIAGVVTAALAEYSDAIVIGAVVVTIPSFRWRNDRDS